MSDVSTSETLERRLERMFAPIVTTRGLDIFDIEITGPPKQRTLRVILDRDSGGVSVSDCSRVSRDISALLDVEDPLPGKFSLEVTSPGVERPLKRRRDFERFVGKRALIKARGNHETRLLEGVLLGVEDADKVRIETRKGVETVYLDEIAEAHLVFDFGRKVER